MSSRYEDDDDGYGSRRRSWLRVALVPLLAFLLGAAGVVWLLTRWAPAASYLGIAPAQAPAPPQAQPPQQPAPAAYMTPPPAMPAAADPETTKRVGSLEQRLNDIASRSQAAAGNADRADALLVVLAARRAVDRGVPLGFIEGLLRQRFGATQPEAVGTIIAASRQPVTVEDLQEKLQEAGPKLLGAGPQQSWWDGVKAELAGLVSIRRKGTASPLPSERLSRAMRRIDAGQVEVALAEVLRLPGGGYASDWVQAARRYVAAHRALDAIETAALTEPRTPPPQPQKAAAPAPAASPTQD